MDLFFRAYVLSFLCFVCLIFFVFSVWMHFWSNMAFSNIFSSGYYIYIYRGLTLLTTR